MRDGAEQHLCTPTLRTYRVVEIYLLQTLAGAVDPVGPPFPPPLAAVAPAVCRPSGSRWTPTPEQIRMLKELYYGCGIRSPSSKQIQRITAMLRQHDKIEGKNVFYWFQNHKAHERQKRRLTGSTSWPRGGGGGARDWRGAGTGMGEGRYGETEDGEETVPDAEKGEETEHGEDTMPASVTGQSRRRKRSGRG
jgi:hypothetical protein